MAVGIDMKLSQPNMGLTDFIVKWLVGLDMKLLKPNMGLADYIIKWLLGLDMKLSQLTWDKPIIKINGSWDLR